MAERCFWWTVVGFATGGVTWDTETGRMVREKSAPVFGRSNFARMSYAEWISKLQSIREWRAVEIHEETK